MKLTVPPLEIKDDEGFSEKDIFKRKEFGEKLANLIENTDGELVIALDAPWGEGKSTFIKMWQGLLSSKEHSIPNIYIDAFAHDYIDDPFIAIASTITNYADDKFPHEKVVADFKEKTKKIGVQLLSWTAKLGVKAATLGTVSATDIGELKGIKDDLSKGVSGVVSDFIEERLTSHAKDIELLESFRKLLSELSQKLNNDKPLVIIIDELDRCKPTYSLKVIERIKHLFAAPHVVFLLVVNRTQLEASVKKEYGTGEADGSRYLQKFINLWISLPKNNESERCDAKTYLSDCIKRMGLEPKDGNEEEWNKMMFERLVIHYDMPLREIERSLTNFALIRSSFKGAPNYIYRWITAYVSIIKVRYPDEYNLLSKGEITFAVLVDKTHLTELKDDWMIPGEKAIESHPLKWLLRYYMANNTEKGKLRTPGNPFSAIELGAGGHVIENSCNWLDSFRRT
ncbi:MAG: hypothetical protein ABS69_15185 [Nitrosomonadales bacterium SCN 54-20]|nr:MAG: hypothetical protein ABS69_15185 [Nitrosomonadales bacterium SCN 54-20]